MVDNKEIIENGIRRNNEIHEYAKTLNKLCSKRIIYIIREVELSKSDQNYKIDIEQSVNQWYKEFIKTGKILKG